MGRYVVIEDERLGRLIERLGQAGKDGFRRELMRFLDSLGEEFLRIVQDEIIRAGSVDTRLLVNSFQKGAGDGVFRLSEGSMTVEVGTNVDYASYVNDGHWTNGSGVATRWVPGTWDGGKFTYQPGSKTGMLLRQRWVEGSHYFDSAIRILDKMLPRLAEKKLEGWLEQYFSGVL